MQRMPPDPRTAGGMMNMNLGYGRRFPAGTVLPLQTLQDVQVGSCVIARAGKFGCTTGMEYTVTNLSTSGVEVTDKRRRKCKIKPLDFVQMFDKRCGPFVEEALRVGVAIRAVMDGETFRAGDVLTLNEVGGSVFGATTSRGAKTNVKRQEVLVAFEFV